MTKSETLDLWRSWNSLLNTSSHPAQTLTFALPQDAMNNGKRSINISLGGGQGSASSTNPFARSSQPGSRPSLGFDDDDGGDLSDSTSGPPKRKLVKLDRGNDDDDDDDAFSRLAPKQSIAPTGPPQRHVDDDDDAFSRLASNKGMATIRHSFPTPPLALAFS